MGARAEKREKILDAAIKTFARKGFHQSRVTDIAQEAGVADGTIYLYFRNKDDVLISIFEEKMKMIHDRMLQSLENIKDPRARLSQFISFHLTQLERYRPLAEIMQVELRLSSKFMKEYVPTQLTEYLNLLATIVQEGQEAGVFRPDVNPAIMKRAIFGAMDELALNWVLTKGRRFDLRRNAEELSVVFLRGLLINPEEATAFCQAPRPREGAGGAG